MPVKPLDEIAVAYPGRAGLKLDTEGFELEAVAGAAETLKRCEFVILEMSVSPRFEGVGVPSALVAHLADAGLQLRDVLSTGAGPGKKGAPALSGCYVYKVGRMRKSLIAMCLLLGACSEIQSATDQAGRDAATSVMPETLALYFPQVPKAFFDPFTHCVVEFATAKEVQALAADAFGGADQGTADVVTGILDRPETQDCLRAKIGDAQMAEAFVQ